MEKKINVYELLKDCPKGMELDSSVWNNIVFEEIDGDSIVIFRKSVDAKVYLTQYGEVNSIDGNCVIFPKGKTTWEGFVPPCKFKDGDIISDSYFDTICIFKGEENLKGIVDFYCGINGSDELFIKDVKDKNVTFCVSVNEVEHTPDLFDFTLLDFSDNYDNDRVILDLYR